MATTESKTMLATEPNGFRAGLLAGLLSALAATFAMFALRALTDAPTPPELLVDLITAVVPIDLFTFVLSQIESAAKVVLLAALIGGQVIVGTVLGGVWGRWRGDRSAEGDRWPALGLAVVLWLFVVLIALPVSGAGYFGQLARGGALVISTATALVCVLYALGLRLLFREVVRFRTPSHSVANPSRRLLILAGVGTIFVAAGGVVIRALAQAESAALARAQAAWDGLIGMSAEITPVGTFYVVSKNAIGGPQLSPSTWQLSIGGQVERPLAVSYEDLRRLPAVEQYATLMCISNEVGGDLIGNALWRGVRLRDLLEQAGLRTGVVDVMLTAADGYTDSITIEKASDPGTILVYEMNGAPLIPEHGFPARLIVPGIYGMKNVKWLTEIHPVNHDYRGYWMQRGWSDAAVVKTMSRIDLPKPGTFAADPSGRTRQIGGIAHAGDRGISKVEVSLDGGRSWGEAQLKTPLSPYSWTLWQYGWSATESGSHRIVVRATDGSGKIQTEQTAPAAPDGASGYHSARVNLLPPV